MNSLTHQVLSVERLYDEADKLSSLTRIEANGLLIFTGKCVERGWISLIIPAIGDGILLFPPASL